MRITFFIAVFFSVTAVKAQIMLPGGFLNYGQPQGFVNSLYQRDSLPQKKWFFSRYTGVSTGVVFFRGGNATMVTMPMSLQLNRRLNNNWYAFANVAVTPAYTSFNRSFLNDNYNKARQRNGPSNSNGIGMYPSASLGLMYMNENKTFSISGSIGVERSSYPILPYYPVNNTRTNAAVPVNR